MSQTTIKGTQVYDRSIDPLYDLKLPTGSNSASIALLGDGTWGTPPSASYAVSASWAPGGSSVSSSYANSSSWSDNVISASYALSASYAPGAPSISASYANSSSWANNVISSSYATTASYAANGGGSSTYIITGSLLLTGSVNNWNPAGLSVANTIYIASMSQSFGINGLVSQSSNRKITLINTGSSFIYIASDHPSSSAWNRIQYVEDVILSPRQAIGLIYDTTAQKWQVESYTPATGYKVITAVVTPGSVTAGDYANVAFTTNGGAATNSISMAAYIGAPQWRLATGTAVPGAVAVSTNKGQGVLGYVGYSHISTEFTLSIQTLSDGTDTYTIEAGMANNPASAAEVTSQAALIRYTHISSSGNWEGISFGTNGTPTTVNLGVPVAINTVYVLRTELNASNTEVRFYINGTLCGIIPTNNNSSTIVNGQTVGAKVGIFKKSGTTNRFIYVSQIQTRVGLTL